MALTWGAATAWAQDISLSAKVDKTATEVRRPVTLTITVSGDLTGLSVLPPVLPEGIVVAGRSQATNFALRAGMMEQSMTMTYVLIPQQLGTFQLGPFAFRHRGRLYQTEPIELTVKKSVLPPSRSPFPAERYTT